MLHGSFGSSSLSASEAACARCTARQAGICQFGSADGPSAADPAVRNLTFAADQEVTADTGTSPYVYVVRTGLLRQVRYGVDGRRHILGLALPGEHLGLEDTRCDGTAIEAATPAQVCRIDRRVLAQAERDSPALREAIYRQRVRRVEWLRWRTWVVGALHPDERICAMLALSTTGMPFARRPDGGGVLTMVLSRTDLADLLSTTPETISRVVHRLEAGGVLRILSPTVFDIRDMDRLIAQGSLSGAFEATATELMGSPRPDGLTPVNDDAALAVG